MSVTLMDSALHSQVGWASQSISWDLVYKTGVITLALLWGSREEMKKAVSKSFCKWLGQAQPSHHSGFHCLLVSSFVHTSYCVSPNDLSLLHCVWPHIYFDGEQPAVHFQQGEALQNSGAGYWELTMPCAQPDTVHVRSVLIGWGTEVSICNKSTKASIRGISLCLFCWRNTVYNNNNL